MNKYKNEIYVYGKRVYKQYSFGRKRKNFLSKPDFIATGYSMTNTDCQPNVILVPEKLKGIATQIFGYKVI